MEDIKKSTQNTLHALLAGSHALSKKYGGKQVFVIKDEVMLLAHGKKGLEDFKRLKAKYGKEPVLTFVPHPGVSYILISK